MRWPKSNKMQNIQKWLTNDSNSKERRIRSARSNVGSRSLVSSELSALLTLLQDSKAWDLLSEGLGGGLKPPGAN